MAKEYDNGEFASYDDYLKNFNHVSEDEPNSDDNSEFDINTETGSNLDANSDANPNIAVSSVVQDTDTSSGGGIFSNLKKSLLGTPGKILDNIKSSTASMFSKAKHAVKYTSETYNIPAPLVTAGFSLVGIGGAAGIFGLLFMPQKKIYSTSDESTCYNLEMINEYEATNGNGDKWTEDSGIGVARDIYRVLASDAVIKVNTDRWTGSKWVTEEVPNPGFGFSDEAIAGMLSNAFAESRLRPDCYEMDYFVHNINEVDEAGNYKYVVGDALNSTNGAGQTISDYELGVNHHSNWNRYVNRMFELYGAMGTSLNKSGYEWRSDNTIVKAGGFLSGHTGLYPGVGLWQWTGQRAYDLGRFANTLSEPEDNDQDLVNDAMYTLDGQLAYLYYENYAGGHYGTYTSDLLTWGRNNKYTYEGKLGEDQGTAYTHMSYKSTGDEDTSLPGKYPDVGESQNTDVAEETSYFGNKLDIKEKNGNIYSTQEKSAYDQNKDQYKKSKETTIRWPKLGVSLTGLSVVGSGGLAKNYVSECYKGKMIKGNLPKYVWDDGDKGGDNHVKALWSVGPDKSKYDNYVAEVNKRNPKIVELEKETGGPDNGYWSVTAIDAKHDKVKYLSSYQSLMMGNGSPNREGSPIRMGREFNRKELDMYESCFEWKPVRDYDPVSVTNEDGSTSTVYTYYIGVELVPKYAELGETRKIFQDPKGGYIVTDLELTTGAEVAVDRALEFFVAFEGGSANNVSQVKKHIRKAEQFYIAMKTSGWTEDEDYSESILQMVDKNKSISNIYTMMREYINKKCDEELEPPSGIADYAVKFAWAKGAPETCDHQATGSEYMQWFTSLYGVVKNSVVYKGDSYYSSCDRSAGTAIVASGADDDFPPGATIVQYHYMLEQSDRWQKIGICRNQGDYDNLEPGDVLIKGGMNGSGHIMIFVGPDAPLEKWEGGIGELTDCKGAVVHGSLGSRGPRCDNNASAQVLSSSTPYTIFRCVGYESRSESSEKKQEADSIIAQDIFCGIPGEGSYREP